MNCSGEVAVAIGLVAVVAVLAVSGIAPPV